MICVCDEDEPLTLLFLLVPAAAETQVCFRYYHGPSGALRATTPSVTIKTSSTAVSVSLFHQSSGTESFRWVRAQQEASDILAVHLCVCVCLYV